MSVVYSKTGEGEVAWSSLEGIMEKDERKKLLDNTDGDLEDKASSKEKSSEATTYEDALWSIGFGKFHILLLLLCGWAVSSDAVEVLSISFIVPSATCDLELSSSDKGWLNSIVFVGMLVGGYLWGSLADRQGRRNILMWSLLCNGIGNLASSVSQVFWLFLLFRFISGIGVGGSMPVVFTYYTEFQHKSKRGSMISLLACFWMAGNIVAAGLAWIVIPHTELSINTDNFSFNSWRVYAALCTIPSISSALLYIFFMPESPKYLLRMGREEEAIKILSHLHHTNKSKRPLKLKKLVLTDENIDEEENNGFHVLLGNESPWWSRFKHTVGKMFDSTVMLFRKPLRRTTVLLLIINFALAFGYYGLFLWFPELFNRIDKYGGTFCELQTGNLTDNSTDCEPPSNTIYLDGFLTSLSNLPGNIITVLIVDRVGRKPLLAISMVLSGVSVFFLWFVETRWQNVLMSCLFGAISVCGFNMLDVLQTELFPTDVRSTAFGVQTAALRVGAILGNIVFGFLLDVHCAIPMFIVASLLAFGGLASLGLPNSTGRDIH